MTITRTWVMLILSILILFGYWYRKWKNGGYHIPIDRHIWVMAEVVLWTSSLLYKYGVVGIIGTEFVNAVSVFVHAVGLLLIAAPDVSKFIFDKLYSKKDRTWKTLL